MDRLAGRCVSWDAAEEGHACGHPGRAHRRGPSCWPSPMWGSTCFPGLCDRNGIHFGPGRIGWSGGGDRGNAGGRSGSAVRCGPGGVCCGCCLACWSVRPGDVSHGGAPRAGSGEDLEAVCVSWPGCAGQGLFRGEAVIWDEDLDREGRQLALRLALRWPWVTCCPPEGSPGGWLLGGGPARRMGSIWF